MIRFLSVRCWLSDLCGWRQAMAPGKSKTEGGAAEQFRRGERAGDDEQVGADGQRQAVQSGQPAGLAFE
jgi:hypothetical protein